LLPHRPQPAGDGRTQVGDHLLVLLPQRQGAAQLGHVLRPVAAVQRLGDLGRRALAAAIAQLGQHLGVAFAGQDGADDLQAGDAGDVPEHLG
jgi:hypothetical protein